LAATVDIDATRTVQSRTASYSPLVSLLLEHQAHFDRVLHALEGVVRVDEEHAVVGKGFCVSAKKFRSDAEK
jgi:hypothetical protein